jgi:hypothetical protein
VQLGRIVVGGEIAASRLLVPMRLRSDGVDIFGRRNAIVVVRGDETENGIGVCACMPLAVALIRVLGFLTLSGLAAVRIAGGTAIAGVTATKAVH